LEIMRKDRERERDLLKSCNSVIVVWEDDWNYQRENSLGQIKHLIRKMKAGVLLKAVYHV